MQINLETRNKFEKMEETISMTKLNLVKFRWKYATAGLVKQPESFSHFDSEHPVIAQKRVDCLLFYVFGTRIFVNEIIKRRLLVNPSLLPAFNFVDPFNDMADRFQ